MEETSTCQCSWGALGGVKPLPLVLAAEVWRPSRPASFKTR
jgi:hypothetical protein